MPGAIPSKMSTFRVWTKDISTYPVLAAVFAGVGFCGYYLSRLATKHNDVTINKKKPYQFRTIGGTPKFLHTKAWTKQELRFNQVSGKWE